MKQPKTTIPDRPGLGHPARPSESRLAKARQWWEQVRADPQFQAILSDKARSVRSRCCGLKEQAHQQAHCAGIAEGVFLLAEALLENPPFFPEESSGYASEPDFDQPATKPKR